MFKEEQPKGLYLLCFSELWERFGYYAVQTIAVLYLTQAFSFTDAKAYTLYSCFGAMLYLTPVLGGYIADHYIGYKNSVLLGGLLYILGYFVTAIYDPNIFLIGLAILCIANGFFKPNVSSLVGDLYHGHDPRRESGFTLFYMAINIGGILPPLFIGPLTSRLGWTYGFLTAALGMAIGMVAFIILRHRLKGRGDIPEKSPLLEKKRALFYLAFSLGLLVLFLLLRIVFSYPEQATNILTFFTAFVVLVVLYFAAKQEKLDRNRMIAALILILLSVGFWAVYMQTFTSLMLYSQRNMAKGFLGFTIDAEFTKFFNPFFIVLLSPFLSKLWVSLEKMHKNPSVPLKFALGIFFLGVGFAFLAIAGNYFAIEGLVSPWILVISFLLQTIGELMLSPIGLSMITRLIPKHLVGMMMGVWFLTLSISFALGGKLAILAQVTEKQTPVESLQVYSHAFLIYTAVALVLSVISFILVPMLNRMIKEYKP